MDAGIENSFDQISNVISLFRLLSMIIFPYFLTDIFFVLQRFSEPLLQVNKIQISVHFHNEILQE